MEIKECQYCQPLHSHFNSIVKYMNSTKPRKSGNGIIGLKATCRCSARALHTCSEQFKLNSTICDPIYKRSRLGVKQELHDGLVKMILTRLPMTLCPPQSSFMSCTTISHSTTVTQKQGCHCMSTRRLLQWHTLSMYLPFLHYVRLNNITTVDGGLSSTSSAVHPLSCCSSPALI